MSRKETKENSPVSEALCVARRETLEEKINSIKKTIYISAGVITGVLTLVNLMLTLIQR